MQALIRWFLHVTGSDNTSGVPYGFWSGFGSDLGEVALIGALLAVYKRHKCAKCWRLAHHPVEGTHYRTCHKHLTAIHHRDLQLRHAVKHPEQNKFLHDKQFGEVSVADELRQTIADNHAAVMKELSELHQRLSFNNRPPVDKQP